MGNQGLSSLGNPTGSQYSGPRSFGTQSSRPRSSGPKSPESSNPRNSALRDSSNFGNPAGPQSSGPRSPSSFGNLGSLQSSGPQSFGLMDSQFVRTGDQNSFEGSPRLARSQGPIPNKGRLSFAEPKESLSQRPGPGQLNSKQPQQPFAQGPISSPQGLLSQGLKGGMESNQHDSRPNPRQPNFSFESQERNLIPGSKNKSQGKLGARRRNAPLPQQYLPPQQQTPYMPFSLYTKKSSYSLEPAAASFAAAGDLQAFGTYGYGAQPSSSFNPSQPPSGLQSTPLQGSIAGKAFRSPLRSRPAQRSRNESNNLESPALNAMAESFSQAPDPSHSPPQNYPQQILPNFSNQFAVNNNQPFARPTPPPVHSAPPTPESISLHQPKDFSQFSVSSTSALPPPSAPLFQKTHQSHQALEQLPSSSIQESIEQPQQSIFSTPSKPNNQNGRRVVLKKRKISAQKAQLAMTNAASSPITASPAHSPFVTANGPMSSTPDRQQAIWGVTNAAQSAAASIAKQPVYSHLLVQNNGDNFGSRLKSH